MTKNRPLAGPAKPGRDGSMTVPLITTAIAVAILVALGSWQLKRMVWKTDLLATIDQRASAPAVAFPSGDFNPDGWNYRVVSLRGRLLHDHEFHVLARRPGSEIGYKVFTPLERDDGSLVMVNRGWVPADHKEPQTRLAGQRPGVVTITGLARRPWTRAWYMPDNDLTANLWLDNDIAAMARVIGRPVAPLFVAADDTPNPGGLPEGGPPRLDIRNDHLQYAITWYLLAIAMGVIFMVYRKQQGSGKS